MKTIRMAPDFEFTVQEDDLMLLVRPYRVTKGWFGIKYWKRYRARYFQLVENKTGSDFGPRIGFYQIFIFEYKTFDLEMALRSWYAGIIVSENITGVLKARLEKTIENI